MSAVEALDPDLVTVVVPARDEADFIEPCLESVLAQEERRLQVLVVDGGSRDGTRDIVQALCERDPRVELLDNPAGIVPTGLNIALAAARGAWFVRVDAHATIPADYVRRAVGHLRTGKWGGVGGRKDGMGQSAEGLGVAAAMNSRYGGSVYHWGEEMQTVEHIPFGCYPTALARGLGGWDEQLPVNQDYEFDHRVREAGHELLFDPALRISWHSRQTVKALFWQYHRYGGGKVAVVRKHPASARLRHVAPSLLIGAVALAVLSRRRRLIALTTLPYAAAVAVASADVGRRLDVAEARRYVPAAFAAMHMGWGIGMWRGAGQALVAHLRGR